MSFSSEYAELGFCHLKSVFTEDDMEYWRQHSREQIRQNVAELVPEHVAERLGKSPFSEDEKLYWSALPALQNAHKLITDLPEILQTKLLKQALIDVIGKDIKFIQSLYFVKSPQSAGVNWHQDEYYLPTRDKSLTGVWVAVDRADAENGALQLVPKSHQGGTLAQMQVQSNQRLGLQAPNVDCVVMPTLEIGDVLLFNGYTWHASDRNCSNERSRDSIVFHCMNAHSLFPLRPGDDFNGKRRYADDFRDCIMVSGEDPYAFKGMEDLLRPFIQKPDSPLYLQAMEEQKID